jgi:ketoreductase RED2
MEQSQRFVDKVALVTGSSSGIGEAIARHFDAAGATVVVNSSQSREAGEAVASSLQRGSYVQGDVGLEEDAHRLINATLERHGRLDVLVNNAGRTQVIPHSDLEAASLDIWKSIFEVNVFGTWALTVAAVDALRASTGCVVNITSIAGLRPTGSSIPYAVSKAALNHMTVLLGKALGPEVRVNAVAPGLVDTPWTADWDVVRDLVGAVAPMKRSATPDDVAQMVLALAENTYVTGQVVTVDGGLTLAS